MNILFEQKQNPIVRQEVCAAYLIGMVKNKQENGSKKSNLSRLKEKKLLSIEEAVEVFGI